MDFSMLSKLAGQVSKSLEFTLGNFLWLNLRERKLAGAVLAWENVGQAVGLEWTVLDYTEAAWWADGFYMDEQDCNFAVNL